MAIARDLPEGPVIGLVKNSLAGMDLSALSDAELMGLMAAAGAKDGALPDRMADINGILDALPAQAREKLVTAFVNNLFSQP